MQRKLKKTWKKSLKNINKRSIFYEKNFNDLKVQKEQIEDQMLFTEERIAGLIRENKFLHLNIREYEYRLANKDKLDQDKIEIDPETGKRVSVEEAIHDLHSLAKIGQEPENALVRSDYKKYLPIEQVEIYEERYSKLSKLYNQVIEEMQGHKANAIGEREIIKERDERIGKLHRELENIKGKQQLLIL